jgi:hypothetical protein
VIRLNRVAFCELNAKSLASGFRTSNHALSTEGSLNRAEPFTRRSVWVESSEPFSRAIWTCSLLKLRSGIRRLQISEARASGVQPGYAVASPEMKAENTPGQQKLVARAESAFREGGFPGNGQVLDPANAIRPGRIFTKPTDDEKTRVIRLELL